MKAITLRGIDDKIYELIKSKSKTQGMSINKFIISCISKILAPMTPFCDDFDEFFGSWDDETYKSMQNSIKRQRKIDKEMWR